MPYSDPDMSEQNQNHEYLQTVPRSVAAMAKAYPAGYVGYKHEHTRAQFLYAASGSMRLTFDPGCWIIPPHRAVWIPAHYPHQTGSIGELEMRTLYLDADAPLDTRPTTPRMLNVPPLLHELILRATEMPIEYDEDGQAGRVINTLLGEIDWSPVHPVSLPSLKDEQLRLMEQRLLKRPSDSSTLGQWAIRLDVSPRTLTRMIRRETQLSFLSWRDHIRTFAAIPMLGEGRPLAEIADAVGYEAAWSFTAMFKRVTGKVPSRYAERVKQSL
jgi:AraC-like DNA-binding protein/quercetin dioxygenase-like cupin family protein